MSSLLRPEEYDEVVSVLKVDEGFRGRPYQDTTGHQTIGYGTLLPITPREAAMLLKSRLNAGIAELEKHLRSLGLDPVSMPSGVCRALANMVYELGMERLLTFKRMWACIARGDWAGAALEVERSRYDRQVHGRAERNAAMMRLEAA